jgi:hypothetical protein
VTLDDLQGAWRRRGTPEGSTETTARELDAARARAGELERTVRRRDRRETLIALALLPVFTYFALRADGLAVRLGSAILVAALVAIPLRLRAARRRTPDPGLPVAQFLRLELEFVLRQRRLLLTVPLWYLGPLVVGVILFYAGASTSPWRTVLYGAVVLAFAAWIYRLNRRAVRQELEPRERELRLWIELAGGEDDPSRRKEEE